MTLKAFLVELSEYLHTTGLFDISMICAPDQPFQESLPDYIHFYPVPMRRGMNLDGLTAVKRMRKIFKEQQFDIVQYSTPNASFYAALAAKSVGVPARLYCQWGIAYVGFSGYKRSIFRRIEKLVCRLSTVIEPDSQGNLQFSTSEKLYDKQKGHVVWNGSASGVNLTKFDIAQKETWANEIRREYGISTEDVVFAFVGRVTKDKGIVELFKAFKRIAEEKSNVKLLMIGYHENSGDVPDGLYQWSLQDPRVIYCGFSNRVEKFLAASDVYVLPSYREGFGSAIIEAEAMGVPVVITDIPGPTDAMLKDETGLIAQKGDSESLFFAFKRLYEDKNLRKEMGDRAHKFASKQFDQAVLFQKIKEDRMALCQQSGQRLVSE